MVLDTTVRARIDNNLKNEVEAIFSEIGITTSQAIVLFLKKVKRERGIPFDLKIPNETTIKAMNEAKNLDGEVCSLDEFNKC
ncbi:MAG: type II toxin-antitoxin system RelB/DinJ family antitoxin [Campylobacterales bacterium]|nr:type II toxin-antitoxin system RelB/DinJ family antitoxin [Campylobacterales bacterium]